MTRSCPVKLDRLIRWLTTPVVLPTATPDAQAEGPAPAAGAPVPEAAVPPAEGPDGAMPPAEAAAGDTPGALNLNDVIRSFVVAVATAIGVVGLLAVVGGAVYWLRISQIGLPTQTTLSVTPKNDLVGLGATGLVIFVGLAVLLVAALYAADPKGRVTKATLLTVAVVGVAALGYVWLGPFEFKSRVLLTVALLALGVACLRIAGAPDKPFVPFGVAVFFSVLLFGAAVTYRTESDHPKVQPAAILRGDDKNGLIGFSSPPPTTGSTSRASHGEADPARCTTSNATTRRALPWVVAWTASVRVRMCNA
jgi:hypothetical protein